MSSHPRITGTQLGRRLALAAAAFVACLLPAACDAAAASEQARPTAGSTTPTSTSRTSTSTDATNSGRAGRTPASRDNAPPTGARPTAPPAAAQAKTPATGRPTTEPDETETDTDDDPTPDASAAPATVTPPAGTAPADNNGLDVLARDCTGSTLPPHTGFQVAPACVQTEFGEVAAGEKSPSLLITDAPKTVATGAPFTISVSTRNLVRDRFLGAAVGGYYLESSKLNDAGLQRGHFHTACRMLDSADQAPDAAPAPAFFVATQDNGGGATPDTVSVAVPGLPAAGTAQCTVWAGDGSHRVPMMQRANQTPAVDSVRIAVGQ